MQSKLEISKRDLRDITALRHSASVVSKMQKDIDRLSREVSVIEGELSVTGSTKSLEDVQQELDALSGEMCVFSLVLSTVVTLIISLVVLMNASDSRLALIANASSAR